MKAYRIDDCDTYAGNDLEEAIAAAMKDTGNPRGDYDPDEDCEVSRDTVVVEEDPPGETTVGAVLDEMDGPGFVCTTEY